ncbi:hypothetical protein ISF_02020 [Cordyceps fumosorosea ARSEF 2679]|uniref:Methyltransferase n=1 Tax=Cordyceps fumosorosea (strain ARSEF 2679) TaxID=1081104 RepID=A0A162MW12_CORFA|nr:hypothetical protein ISF_02020 [Cordyceps fumosorosea ARSEF 2679]OAA71469.1 hypothetical protein ISF_02020 [Cordyceps fumosorosea ARSEF 2679]
MAAAAVQSAPIINAGQPRVDIQQRPEEEPRVPKHDVTATLNFYLPNADGSPPPPAYVGAPESYRQTPDPHPVLIRDIAGSEDQYSLDVQGFEVRRRPATERDFVDDAQIKASYYPETEQLLKDVTGADRVFIFDHTIRRVPAGTPLDAVSRPPVQQVHVDQTYSAALSRVTHHFPEAAEAAALLRGRVQIINVWRPIRTVRRDPLAVADARSVPEADLVSRALIYPNREGATFSVRRSEGQRWYYRSGLGPGEALLIKCFDSKEDGRARRAPHTAFVDPEAPEDAPTRESIEVRALVFHTTDRD